MERRLRSQDDPWIGEQGRIARNRFGGLQVECDSAQYSSIERPEQIGEIDDEAAGGVDQRRLGGALHRSRRQAVPGAHAHVVAITDDAAQESARQRAGMCRDLADASVRRVGGPDALQHLAGGRVDDMEAGPILPTMASVASAAIGQTVRPVSVPG